MAEFHIEYFTDPLCCWSWAMEPQWRKLRYLLKGRLTVDYVMGGLLKDWNHFSDKMNDIDKPSQFGPLWMEAQRISGQPINESFWITHPIESSYPACMAVKAAQAQSKIAGEAMLRELREAAMIHQKNIGETQVLLEIAAGLEKKKILESANFEKCLFSAQPPALLKEDLNLVKIKEISRFPTLLIRREERTVQITGYRPFSVLLKTFELLDPGFAPGKIDKKEYLSNWETLTNRELDEISIEEKAS